MIVRWVLIWLSISSIVVPCSTAGASTRPPSSRFCKESAVPGGFTVNVLCPGNGRGALNISISTVLLNSLVAIEIITYFFQMFDNNLLQLRHSPGVSSYVTAPRHRRAKCALLCGCSDYCPVRCGVVAPAKSPGCLTRVVHESTTAAASRNANGAGAQEMLLRRGKASTTNNECSVAC